MNQNTERIQKKNNEILYTTTPLLAIPNAEKIRRKDCKPAPLTQLPATRRAFSTELASLPSLVPFLPSCRNFKLAKAVARKSSDFRTSALESTRVPRSQTRTCLSPARNLVCPETFRGCAGIYAATTFRPFLFACLNRGDVAKDGVLE